MKKVLILLAAVCVASAMAENVVLKTIDFETSEGYQAGDLLNQNGWYSIYSDSNRQMVVNDSTAAPSGTQYVDMDYDADHGVNSAVKFDVSEDFENGNKLRISWYSRGSEISGKTHYTKLHNIGTTGRNFDVEIAEFTIGSSGWANLTVSKEDKSGTVNLGKFLTNPTDWHFCQLTVDPADKTIKEWVLDGEVIFDGSAVYYYKNEGYNNAYKGLGGNLIDGVRIMNYGAFDGFKVEMVPEPAVFGLLALLGLFFARKQR